MRASEANLNLNPTRRDAVALRRQAEVDAAWAKYTLRPALESAGGVLADYHRAQHRKRMVLLCGAWAALMLSFAVILMISAHGKEYVARASVGKAISAGALVQADAPAGLPEPSGPAEKSVYLVMGSDQRPDDNSFRTDVMILVFVNPEKGTVSLVSFPRDLWVDVPAYGPMKINSVMTVGGFDAAAQMFENEYGVRPAHYLLTNFDGFRRVVDTLGGVEVETRSALSDSCDLPWRDKDGQCSVGPGRVSMDGDSALWYVRSRHSSSDFDRLRRSQEVLWAIFNKAISAKGLTHGLELYNLWKDNVKTDMDLGNFSALAPLAMQIASDPERVRRYVVGEDLTGPFWTYNGMWALWPDKDGIKELIRKAEAGE